MKILDIGTGSGVFLKAANKNFASASLFGHDINDNFMSELETIPNFKEFFYGNIDTIQTKFELISLIHVLEHVLDPIVFLKQIKTNLTKDGYLIINVPDSENNPIDLAIYDHCTHFQTTTLINVLGKAGFEVSFISNKKIPREIIIIAKIGKYKSISKNNETNFVKKHCLLKEYVYVRK
jgi:trans-aconitate methyltransferase